MKLKTNITRTKPHDVKGIVESKMYIPISIKTAMGKINQEWFLPAIQRPYVWGNRYESEKYICKLFDSLFHRYPIGGIILWAADTQKVAYREFLRDFHTHDSYKNVPEFQWERKKCLVYDGQQRLQTIYSCLQYTFNDRLLIFDLAYNEEKDTEMETGFRFVDKNESIKKTEISLIELFSCSADDKIKKARLKKEHLPEQSNEEQEFLIDSNLDTLWNVIVGDGKESLAYYEISSTEEDKVNEIFERLNTGGISLSNSDLLYSRIKADYPDFEADVMSFVKRKNVILNHYDLLQLLHLAVKRRVRVSEKVNKTEISDFVNTWNNMQRPLQEFFDRYLVERLGITDISVLRTKQPLYIIILFLYKLSKNNRNYNSIKADQFRLIDKFLITAELNDWTLQGYIDNFTNIILDNSKPEIFPWDTIRKYVEDNPKRNIEINEEIFCSYPWFSLKILTSNRKYSFLNEKSLHRFNPEIDHIYPRGLKGKDKDYSRRVDIVWNMQPVEGDVNNQKRNHHPFLYFTDAMEDGKQLNGSEYMKQYDFLPDLNNKNVWQDPDKFIEWRKTQMLAFLKAQYDIVLKYKKQNDAE